MPSNKTYLVLIGSGEFARAFGDRIESLAKEAGQGVHPISWKNSIEVQSSQVPKSLDDVDSEELAFLHVGSGRQFEEALEYCKRRKALFIEASTAELKQPGHVDFPYVEAPNLSIPIVKLFKLFENGKELFSDMEGRILESHQAAKKSVPGTALQFAELLGISKEEIESVRDPDRQESELRIPKDHLDGHAYHQIELNGLGVDLEFRTSVLGRETYLRGLLEILRIRGHLEKKWCFVSDLIDAGLL